MSPYDEKPKSERIIDELKRRQQERAIVDVDEKLKKIVIFSIASKRYAFYGSSVKEILPLGSIFWLPSLPDFLPGLISIRGDIESVVDIRYFLGEGGGGNHGNYIVLVDTGSFRAAILVDTIDDVTDIPLCAITPTLATLTGAARELVCGEIDWCHETVALLDIAKLEARITL